MAGKTVQVVHAVAQRLATRIPVPTLMQQGLLRLRCGRHLHAGSGGRILRAARGDLVQVQMPIRLSFLGNVLRPLAIALKEPLTVSKAIAMAGGTAPSTKKDKVRIIRQLPGKGKQEILVDLKAIEKNRAEDVALLANDIVDVPISGTKSILRSLLGTVVPSVGQLPVRVIP